MKIEIVDWGGEPYIAVDDCIMPYNLKAERFHIANNTTIYYSDLKTNHVREVSQETARKMVVAARRFSRAD